MEKSEKGLERQNQGEAFKTSNFETIPPSCRLIMKGTLISLKPNFFYANNISLRKKLKNVLPYKKPSPQKDGRFHYKKRFQLCNKVSIG